VFCVLLYKGYYKGAYTLSILL